MPLSPKQQQLAGKHGDAMLLGGHKDGATFPFPNMEDLVFFEHIEEHPLPGQPATIYRYSDDWSERLNKPVLAATSLRPPPRRLQAA